MMSDVFISLRGVFNRTLSIYHIVFNVHFKEFNHLLVGETSRLGVFLRERDDSDSPNKFFYVMASGGLYYLIYINNSQS